MTVEMRKEAVGDIQSFESSLAAIGRTVMASKCPSLFKHEIGFQVLDSDEDNTRAVGVFGFRVGKRILYAPLFYREGQVKGTEQLRDPKRDLTVPLTDNWVNKILTDVGTDHGTRTPRYANKDTAQPSLWQMRFPPSKYASDDRNEFNAAVAEMKSALAHAIGKRPSLPGTGVDLIETAAQYPAIMRKVASLMRTYPWFKEAIFKYHGEEKLNKAIERYRKVAATRPKPVDLTLLAPRKSAAAKVTVTHYKSVKLTNGPLLNILDFFPQEANDLTNGKNLYTDNRGDDEVSKITIWVGGQTGHDRSVSNPNGDGVYKVLCSDLELHDCLVICPPIGWGTKDPDNRGRCLVVRLKDGAFKMTHHGSIWTQGEADPHEYNVWVKGLPEVKDKITENKWYVALTQPSKFKAMGTSPFCVRDNVTGEAVTSYASTKCDAPFWDEDPHPMPELILTPRRMKEYTPKRVRVWDRPGVPFRSGTILYIPKGTHLFELDYEKRLDLAEKSDVDEFLLQIKEAAAQDMLSVGTGGSGYYKDDSRVEKRSWFTDPMDLEIDLVINHGLRVPEARQLLDAARTKGAATVAIKYAKGHYQGMDNDWPNAPVLDNDANVTPGGFADDVIPTQTNNSLAVVINDLLQQPGTTDRYRPWPIQAGSRGPMEGIGNGPVGGGYKNIEEDTEAGPGDKDLKTVATGAATGRREIFDTAALASLVKHTRLQRLLDEVLPRVAKSVSDLADLLAHMYWNVDEWVEQFGESEIGPLEDQLKDVFEGLGDVYLQLQEKQVVDPRDHGILPGQFKSDGADANS